MTSKTETITTNETRYRDILRRFYNDDIRALGDPEFDTLPPDQLKALEEIASFKFYVFHYHLDRIISAVLHVFGFHGWKRPEIEKVDGQYKKVKKCTQCSACKIVGVLAALIVTFTSCAPGNNFKHHYNYDPARTTGRRIISEEEISAKIGYFSSEYFRLEDSLQLTEKGTVEGVRIIVRQIKLLDSAKKYLDMYNRPVPTAKINDRLIYDATGKLLDSIFVEAGRPYWDTLPDSTKAVRIIKKGIL